MKAKKLVRESLGDNNMSYEDYENEVYDYINDQGMSIVHLTGDHHHMINVGYENGVSSHSVGSDVFDDLYDNIDSY